MKKVTFMYAILTIFAILFPLFVGVACQGELSPVDILPTLNNDLKNGELVLQSSIDGIQIVREYSTSYNTDKWRVTDSKVLKMNVYTYGSETATVMVEHVHIDVNIQSTLAYLDGWIQDSMDDSFHGTQGGFWISDTISYYNIFAIQGFSETLIDGWNWYFNGVGAGGITEYRLTEKNLVEYGHVYANKFSVIYDVIVKKIGEPYFHVYCIADEFLVPVGNVT